MKSLKKIIIKNKLVVGALVALILLGAVTFYYINYRIDKSVGQSPVSTEEEQQQEEQTTDTQVQNNVDNKKAPETNAPSETTTNTPQSTNGVELAKSISIQGVYNKLEGKADLSIQGMASYYSVDKLVGTEWKQVLASTFYPGHGGQFIDTLMANNPAGLTTTYRVYPVIDGVRAVNFAEIDVNWNLLVSKGVTSSTSSAVGVQ